MWLMLSFRQDYVHRIGRTGRAGQKGHAVTLIVERDAHALRGIVEAAPCIHTHIYIYM